MSEALSIRPMTLNPFRLIRRRRRLREAIDDEVAHLRRVHGDGARDAALEKAKRTDLTKWGRQVVEGAAKRLRT